MAKQTIGIGTSPNDGTGDAIRDAFDKVNDNFDEIYAAFTPANSSTSYGNSTVNTVVNSQSISVGGNVTINTSAFFVGNSTSNIVITRTTLAVGNSTVNCTANTSTLTIGNSTLSSSSLKIGNSTVNTTVNSSSVTITSNSGLTVGNSQNSANGFTFLPNGFKINWGWVSANSTDGNATFFSAFTTNAYSVIAVANTTTATYQAAVVSVNNTVVAIRTANATSTNVFWQAIGT